MVRQTNTPECSPFESLIPARSVPREMPARCSHCSYSESSWRSSGSAADRYCSSAARSSGLSPEDLPPNSPFRKDIEDPPATERPARKRLAEHRIARRAHRAVRQLVVAEAEVVSQLVNDRQLDLLL